MYNLASELPEMYRDIAIEFVDRHFQQSELNEIGKLVAQNRDFYGCFFTDTAAAEEWLGTQT